MQNEARPRETRTDVLAPAPGNGKPWHDFAWSALGLVAVAVAGYLLYNELSGISPRDISHGFARISPTRWALAIGASLVAYLALAFYDRIALLHLGKPLNWLFISITSFTTYALAHNIGASVFSGAAVRYRAYSTKGLTAAEVGVLVVFTAFTFFLGTVLLAGVVLICEPAVVGGIMHVPPELSLVVGVAMLGFVALYLIGSWLELRPLSIRGFKIVYPRLPIALRQLVAAPLELIGASAIIYFAMPAEGNPGYFVVLAVFLVSFSAAIVSHAPGGLGVLELLFISTMPQVPKAELLVALLVFRLLYLLVPLALALVVVAVFEKGRLTRTLRARPGDAPSTAKAARIEDAAQHAGRKSGRAG